MRWFVGILAAVLILGLALWLTRSSEPPAAEPAPEVTEASDSGPSETGGELAPGEAPPAVAPASDAGAATRYADAGAVPMGGDVRAEGVEADEQGAQAAARTPAVSATDPASRVAPPRGLDPNNLRATGDFRSGIRRSFDTATPALRDCYQELLEFEPGLVDDLVFEVEVVMIEGEVDAELIAIEAPNTQIDDLDCFARAVDDVSFPAPEGEDPVTVRYPIALRP